jgi:hypothetical protein
MFLLDQAAVPGGFLLSTREDSSSSARIDKLLKLSVWLLRIEK